MDDIEDQVPDMDLIERLRQGDRDASVELWTRHYPAVLLAAGRVTRQPRDAEEIASDAFSGMLSAVASGAGPTTAVRAYLMTSVRNLAASRARRSSATEVLTDDVAVFDRPTRDTTAHMTELELVRVAFAALPRRWQIVLWRTAVDRDSNIDVGRAMDLSPNGVAALAKRARRGFRLSYLRAHLSDRGVSEECQPFIDGLADLTVSEANPPAGVKDHVAECTKCTGRLAELRHVDLNFAGLLGPAVLGLVPAHTLLASAGASAPTVVKTGLAHSDTWSRLGGKWALGSIGAVGASTIAIAMALGASPEAPVAPTAASSPKATFEPPVVPSASPSATLSPSSSTTEPDPVSSPSSSPRPTPTPVLPRRTIVPVPPRVMTPTPTPTPTPSTPTSTATPTPTSPLTVQLSVRGPRTETSIDVSASAQGTTGPMRLVLELPDDVSLLDSGGDWQSCTQSGTIVTCSAGPDGTTWAGTLRTVWGPAAQGVVRATVQGTYHNGAPANGSVESSWPS